MRANEEDTQLENSSWGKVGMCALQRRTHGMIGVHKTSPALEVPAGQVALPQVSQLLSVQTARKAIRTAGKTGMTHLPSLQSRMTIGESGDVWRGIVGRSLGSRLCVYAVT